MQDIVSFLQLHWPLSVALIVVLFSLIILEFIHQKRSAARLSPARATLLLNHSNAVVMDIRTPALFSEGHIIGAFSFPISDFTEKRKKLEKYKSQPIIVACATGAESPRAAVLLTREGYDVKILAGGMRAWREADMPLVKE